MREEKIVHYINTAWRAFLNRYPSREEIEDSKCILQIYNNNDRFIDHLKRLSNKKVIKAINFKKPESLSVVINTCNRGASLGDAIVSLIKQKEVNVEIVVVVGPCKDNTWDVVKEFSNYIKAYECSELNLSISRNIGISHASGDVVAFIDDDAVAEQNWAKRIMAAYSNASIGGVGGWVLDNTGTKYQAKTIICDRYGCAVTDRNNVTSDLFNVPSGFYYSALIGTNSSFRRDILTDIGGFDEEFEYFLDETDVCARVVDRGFTIKQVPDAVIYHRFLPSHIRCEKKIITNYYPIFKNTTYFTLKNNEGHLSRNDAFVHAENVYKHHLHANMEALKGGHISKDLVDKITPEFERAMVAAGNALENNTAINYFAKHLKQPDKVFKIANSNRAYKHIILTCRTFHLSDSGIAKFIQAQAKALADAGHAVRVLTISQDGNETIDFQNGYWVHRLKYQEKPVPVEELGFSLHSSMWSASAIMYDEAKRISAYSPIDVVETPIWDCEGVCFVKEKTFPHIVHLETSFGIALESHADWQADKDFLNNVAYPAIECENYIIRNSTVVRPLSRAILKQIEMVNKFGVNKTNVFVCPVAVPDFNIQKRSAFKSKTKDLNILFIGRLEERKGIDTLFSAIPLVLDKNPSSKFILIGNDALLDHLSGRTYAELFKEKYPNLLSSVNIKGKVSDEELFKSLQEADIFVAPSKFESFGIMNVEAMMMCVPVVSCSVGGIEEVLDGGNAGALVAPNDPEALARKLCLFIENPDLRKQFIDLGRSRYDLQFKPDINAKQVVSIYEEAQSRFLESGININSKSASSIQSRLEQIHEKHEAAN